MVKNRIKTRKRAGCIAVRRHFTMPMPLVWDGGGRRDARVQRPRACWSHAVIMDVDEEIALSLPLQGQSRDPREQAATRGAAHGARMSAGMSAELRSLVVQAASECDADRLLGISEDIWSMRKRTCWIFGSREERREKAAANRRAVRRSGAKEEKRVVQNDASAIELMHQQRRTRKVGWASWCRH